MDIVIYSRKGSHYYAYDDPNEWNTVATFTNWTGGDSTKLPFEEEVSLKVNASVAFYIAIVVVIIGEWGPVVCSSRVSVSIVYFTCYMHLCFY